MSVGLMKVLGPVLGRAVASWPVRTARDWWSRRQARDKAAEGHDFVHQASLKNLLSRRFQDLIKSRQLPAELKFLEFAAWLRQDNNLDDFITVLIASAANRSALASEASERLSDEYGRVTGESPKLAPGRIALAISWVLGDLQATQSGRDALRDGLAFFNASQGLGRSPEASPEFPSDADLSRMRAMAAATLEVGRHRWKMPRFVASLSLTVTDESDGATPVHTDIDGLVSAVVAGKDIVIFGEGGMGKTTLLLDLCSACLSDEKARIPFYVDASVWARSGASLSDFLASSTSARQYTVTSGELANLAERGLMTVMINGWNEIPAAQKSTCAEYLRDFAVAEGNLNTVIVSRSAGDPPALRTFKKIKVGGLSWSGQSQIIRAELGDSAKQPLLDLLARNNRLRHAARSPLILRGLIENARTHVTTSDSVYDLLEAVVRAFEEGEQRSMALNDSPVFGYHQKYLEELAFQLTDSQSTSISQDDAVRAVTWVARSLSDLLGPPPASAEILAVLGRHHLLHIEDGAIRFAHQRFQEFFAAKRLLGECSESGKASKTLMFALNSPAWEDALFLAAGKLRGAESREARLHLIEAAEQVDTGLACDLIGISGFCSLDSFDTHRRIVQQVEKLATSNFKEIRELGLRCAITSGLADFSESLWKFLEAPDETKEWFRMPRSNGFGLALTQLGTGAEARLLSWPAERRTEFLHEISDNPDNFDFLVKVANSEPEPSVRTAAIAALFWNFPASDAPIHAWLGAPSGVQLSYDLISNVSYAVEDGLVSDEVKKKLQEIAVASGSKNTQISLAHSFPKLVGPLVIEAIFEYLGKDTRSDIDTQLLEIARTNAPDRLMALAKDLMLTRRGPPDWAIDNLMNAKAEHRRDVFERAWSTLQTENFEHLSPIALGPLSDLNQTQRSLDVYLKSIQGRGQTKSKVDYERERLVRQLLVNAPGNFLLKEAVRRSGTCSYEQAAEMLQVLFHRMNGESSQVRRTGQWLPTVTELRELIDCFRDMQEPAGIWSDEVFVLLACIASMIAPEEFCDFVVEAYRRQLEAWSNYQDAFEKWANGPRRDTQRPQNPSYGNWLNAAVGRVGPTALPALNALMTHPCAIKVLPEAICAAAVSPWESSHSVFYDSMFQHVKEGKRRTQFGRALRQPTPEFQPATDESARLLGQMLTDRLALLADEKARAVDWKPQFAKNQVDGLLGKLARIPSPEIVAPLNRALSSGLVMMNGALDAWKGLLQQGATISERSVVAEIEALYGQQAGATWLEEWPRHQMGELSELLFCIEPNDLLKEPRGYYLEQWKRYSSPNEIVRRLSERKLQDAWPVFLAWGSSLATGGRPPEQLVPALTSTLTVKNLPEYLRLITDGTLFTWLSGTWELERYVASPLASLIGNSPDNIALFAQACRDASSPAADALAGAVLAKTKLGEPMWVTLALEALDSGRALDPENQGFRQLLEMFWKDVATKYEGQYEIHPRSCNTLRTQLYGRAKSSGAVAVGCRRLLASVECSRREQGRPADEIRHPVPSDGESWTDVLAGEPSSYLGTP